VLILVLLIRWTCSAGARRAIEEENAEHQLRRQLVRDVQPENRRIVIR
jgi:hypothetical protein